MFAGKREVLKKADAGERKKPGTIRVVDPRESRIGLGFLTREGRIEVADGTTDGIE